MIRMLTLTLLLPLFAACTGPACLNDQPYHTAKEFPPLRVPAGMQAPEPDPNLAIPEVAENGPVGAFPPAEGEEEAVEDTRRCLVSPPRMQDARG